MPVGKVGQAGYEYYVAFTTNYSQSTCKPNLAIRVGSVSYDGQNIICGIVKKRNNESDTVTICSYNMKSKFIIEMNFKDASKIRKIFCILLLPFKAS